MHGLVANIYNVGVVRLQPQRALHDLSVSLLLDSSSDNISCYLQRGMLYIKLARQACYIGDST